MVKRYKKKDPNLEKEAENYQNPVPSRDFILQYMQEEARPVSLRHIIEAFELTDEAEQEGMRRRLIAMARDGQLMSNRRGSYAIVDSMDLIRGVVQGHRDGFGFVIPDQGGNDIFLPAREMHGVFTDDVVLVRAAKQKGSKREGTVVEILERNTHELIGRYFRDGEIAFVQPDNKGIAQDILVADGHGFELQDGDYVCVEILTQPTKRRQATATVVEVIGDALTPGMESRLAAHAHGIPTDWPEEVEAESEAISQVVTDDQIKGRLDLRKLPFVTIDGEDSRDFDDAVYAEPVKKGQWKLYVAIADVAEYVKQNTALDDEAYERGNSVYFPNEVIPMLPEHLSNGICSLNPHEDRLVLVCEMKISDKGVVTGVELYEAVIHSHARLTYNEVGQVLAQDQAHERRTELDALNCVFHLFLQQRKLRGTIEFEVDEPFFHFDDKGKIKAVTVRSRNDAHKIIEEAMLAANVAVATYLEKNKLSLLYRVHATPDAEKLKKLRDFLQSFSLKLAGQDKPTARDYSQLMSEIKGREDAHLLQTVVLRSMQQAVYSSDNLGHFGLAYDRYCHFTSPIRRYPDLLVHRAIKHVLHHKKKPFSYTDQDYINFGEHLSVTERRADRATREAMDRLKCEFMLDKVGETFEARIIDVTSFGLFVECNDCYIQGLVHITALPNDYYDHNATGHCLTGKRGGKVFRLGDSITVLVARVDPDEKNIDFVLEM